ncbi:malate synthase A [Aliidiomarina sanyensis]|uniref:malate synthase n=1 Tax=Aliidiomarina sanyensis TaxID=1249555 RepID=A0A432WBS7_9GAMM|nr:malate synthase A [Aliidiomarina sanyensis]RUO29070.1 malate synthase A [Aliidiomarina sanyensis]
MTSVLDRSERTAASANELSIAAAYRAGADDILTPTACQFLAALVEAFQERHQELLAQRDIAQAQYDAGALPDFDPATRQIRDGQWRVAPIPGDLQKRHLEITGPVDRKMVINALNSDVDVFMADFEDAQSPTWEGLIQGQRNLKDANQGTIQFTDIARDKSYQLNDKTALLIARVRGLHLPEKHVEFQGQPIPGALFDFALYFYHNVKTRTAQGSGVYYYIPKLQHHQEAVWWNDVFAFTENYFAQPKGTIRCTVLIETLPAVFQMHEILHALKDYIVGLNCGRWDYIFSYIKTLRAHPDRLLPDRHTVTMQQPFLHAYSRLLIQTCHQRGAFAMGGMAALIPSKEPAENETIFAKVRADKEREFGDGHDGTWIAHPGLAPIVRDVAAKYIGDYPNQLHVTRSDDPPITQADLLTPCPGPYTESGVRTNLRVGLQYIAAWLAGKGCVPIEGLMEDAATAEICRTSIWQLLTHKKTLDCGTPVTADFVLRLLDEEARKVTENTSESLPFEAAQTLLKDLIVSPELTDFLTLPGYRQL